MLEGGRQGGRGVGWGWQGQRLNVIIGENGFFLKNVQHLFHVSRSYVD